MINKRRIAIAILLLIVCGISVASVFNILGTSERLKVNVEGDKIIESPLERSWNQEFIGDDIQLHNDIGDSVYRGVQLIKLNQDLYVTDYGDMSVKSFSKEGKFIRTFGDRQGRGPGEFLDIMGMARLPGDTLFIQDLDKREMMVFDATSGTYLTSHTIKYRPYRLTSVGNKIVAHATLVDSLFKVYDSRGRLIREFGNIVNNQVANTLAISGDIVSVGDGKHFVYSPSRASYLFFFDINGNEVRRVLTPDRIFFKKPEMRQSGNTRIASPSEIDVMVFDLAVYGDKLFVSATRRDENRELDYSFVDVYDINTGKYLESFKLPELGKDVVITQNRLYYLGYHDEQVKANQLNL